MDRAGRVSVLWILICAELGAVSVWGLRRPSVLRMLWILACGGLGTVAARVWLRRRRTSVLRAPLPAVALEGGESGSAPGAAAAAAAAGGYLPLDVISEVVRRAAPEQLGALRLVSRDVRALVDAHELGVGFGGVRGPTAAASLFARGVMAMDPHEVQVNDDGLYVNYRRNGDPPAPPPDLLETQGRVREGMRAALVAVAVAEAESAPNPLYRRVVVYVDCGASGAPDMATLYRRARALRQLRWSRSLPGLLIADCAPESRGTWRGTLSVA